MLDCLFFLCVVQGGACLLVACFFKSFKERKR